jgi:hypothetical protein
VIKVSNDLREISGVGNFKGVETLIYFVKIKINKGEIAKIFLIKMIRIFLNF